MRAGTGSGNRTESGPRPGLRAGSGRFVRRTGCSDIFVTTTDMPEPQQKKQKKQMRLAIVNMNGRGQ